MHDQGNCKPCPGGQSRGQTRTHPVEHSSERTRDAVWVECRGEQLPVADLATATRADEPPQLLVGAAFALRRLALHDAQRRQLTFALDDALDGFDTEGADELVLEVAVAHEESECLKSLAGQVLAEAGALQSATESRLLPCVAQATDLQVASAWSVMLDVSGDVRRATDRHDRHPVASEVEVSSRRQRVQRGQVTQALDEHDGSDVVGDRVHNASITRARSRPTATLCCGGMSVMDVSELLLDLYGRIPPLAREAVEGLDKQQLTSQPNGTGNPIAWLVWHIARVQDAELAGLVGDHQLWQDGDWAARFGLEPDPNNHGYGHTAEDVRAVRPDGAAALLDYFDAVNARTQDALRALTPSDLDRIVDPDWDPPVTLGVRLISVADDAIQHIGQAAYVRGLLGRSVADQ
jgi:uncharacterized damage-inducible protein DinB